MQEFMEAILYFNYPNVDFNVSYVWAKNQTNESPLSEIPPLEY